MYQLMEKDWARERGSPTQQANFKYTKDVQPKVISPHLLSNSEGFDVRQEKGRFRTGRCSSKSCNIKAANLHAKGLTRHHPSCK